MVTLKLARTADGFAAGDEHDARLAITGEAANLRVQVMRSLHDAIMVGIGTARDDDPLLTVRLPGLDARPLRVILDSRLDLPLQSRLVRDGAASSRRWSSRRRAAARSAKRRLTGKGVEVARVDPDSSGRVDLERSACGCWRGAASPASSARGARASARG